MSVESLQHQFNYRLVFAHVEKSTASLEDIRERLEVHRADEDTHMNDCWKLNESQDETLRHMVEAYVSQERYLEDNVEEFGDLVRLSLGPFGSWIAGTLTIFLARWPIRDRDFVLEAMKHEYNGVLIGCVSPRICDSEILHLAINSNPCVIQFVSPETPYYSELALAAVKQFPYGLEYIHAETQISCLEIPRTAVEKDEYVQRYVPEKIYYDPEIVRVAQKQRE